MEMACEVLPVVDHTPVLAGVCGKDPFRLMDIFLRQVEAAGFAGVQNFPTVGLYDGTFRDNLEETGMGYDLEAQMIATAAARGMVTAPYVFDVPSAVAMARAGPELPVPHMELTPNPTTATKTPRTHAAP